jgi:glucan 1,3-beta-glucosidase
MPEDPREATGYCGNNSPWEGPFPAWHTGGAGAGQNVRTEGLVWPPTVMSKANMRQVPTYVPAAEIITLPGPTFTPAPSKTIDVGNGWANPSDTIKLAVMPSGCPYIDPWIGPDRSVTPCTGPAAAAAPDPAITPPPDPAPADPAAADPAVEDPAAEDPAEPAA